MRRKTCLGLILSALVFLPAGLQAFQPPQQTPLPNFDKRLESVQSNAVSDVQIQALEKLRGLVPKLQVEFDPVLGAPKSVSAMDDLLSGVPGQGQPISLASLNAFTSDSNAVTRAFLYDQRELFGHGPEVLDAARVVRDYVTEHNGLHTVVWQQQSDGIGIFEAVLISHTTAKGELVNMTSQFLPDPDLAAANGTPDRAFLELAPDVTARLAVALAAQNVGVDLAEGDVTAVSQPETGPEQRQRFTAPGLKGEAEAKLIWLPLARDNLQLCWDVIVMSRQRGEMFRELLDVRTGAVLLRRCLTSYLTDATYNVYTSDSPSPFSPGWPTPNSAQPPLVSRTLVTLPAMNTNASPLGWINDGGNETLGNNVDSHTDRNSDNAPDLPRPQGSPFRTFNFAINLATQDPTNYSQGAVVQLFYLCNWYHDKLYELGFTEAAGNFQSNNFGRGGLGNDPVQADAQDGSGTDNANFSTPPDGSSGRMQMYIFTGPSPRRDGDLDAEIVFHEHTHGLSWRLVGGGQALGDMQSDGMGEGWSDWYGLTILSEAGDNVNGNYAAGGYATYQLAGLTQNYYFGIRRYPYSTDMTKNPLTFKDIDPAQASTHPGIPRSPIIGSTANEVHNEGEVWCVTLWDARANLINKYGWAVGNQLILQLVTDGMKLTVPHPNFLQARDGILQADQVDNGGANRNELWAAFAKRGMGFSATSPASSTTVGLHESFDLPDDLQVNPGAGLVSSGQIGGPFIPTCQLYAVTNAGTNVITWTVAVNQPWVTLTGGGGTLPVGGSSSVNACINSTANTLSVGNYSAAILFSNQVSHVVITRTVALEVSPPRVVFFPLDSDPGWTRQGEWAFGKPAGLGGTSFGRPDPSSGFTGSNVFGINLNGDYSVAVGGPYYLTAGPFNLSTFTTTQLRFQRWLNTDYQPWVYATLDVSTNGTTWTNIWNNDSSPISDTTWTRVTYDLSAFADRQPAVYLRWGHRVGQAGAFAYSGWNLDDIELLGTPTGPLSLVLSGSAAEDAGVATNAGGILLSSSLPTNLVVSLSSDTPGRLTTPPTVTVLAGQLTASFDLTLIDNAIQDGNQLVTVTASAPGFTNVTSTILVVDDEAPPVITGQPAAVTTTVGGSASFSVTATGKPPLSYAWRRNGLPITGANSPSYTTNNVQSIDSGSLFSCVVSNNYGITPSSDALLTVIVAPSNDFCASAMLITTTSFTVSQSTVDATSTGDPIPSCVGGFAKGLWYVYTPPTNGTLVVDTIGSSFDTGLGAYTGTCGVFTQVGCDDDGGGGLASKITLTVTGGTTYRILAGGFGGSSGSLIFHLVFTGGTGSSPTILVNPASQTVPVNGSATFTVSASGTAPLSYFWRRNGLPITGANSPSYTTNNVQLADSGTLFSCLVSNAFGTALSGSATLTVTSGSVPAILNGNYVYLPIATTGAFIANGTGGRFNSAGTGGATGVDFWYPGTPVYNYVVGVGGINYPNGAFTSVNVTNLSTPSLQHALISGTVVPGLSLTRDVSFGANSRVIQVVDTLQNTGATPLVNVVLMDTTDPDQDSIAPYNNYATLNDVVSVNLPNDLVVASGPSSGLSVGFGSESGLQIPSAIGFNNMDAYAYLTVVDPGGATADIDVNLVQNYGTLAPGQTRSVVWQIVFGNSKDEVINTFSTNGASGFQVFAPLSVQENAGVLTNSGVVVIGSALPTNLVVALTSSIPTRLTVPASVTIAAGQTSSNFNLTVINNSIHDGNQTVNLTATAPGLSASASVLVVDDDVPPTITLQPVSQSITIGSSATFTVNASGSAPLSYFWRLNGSIMPGATGTSFTTNSVPLAASGSQFSCLVSNAFGTAFSSNATLTVYSGPVFLTGNYLYLPIDSNGVFIANSTGGKFNSAGTGGSTGVDFWFPGSPVYNYVVGAGGVSHANGNFSGVVVSNVSVAGLQHAVVSATVIPGLAFTRDISFPTNSKVIQIVDTLRNTGGSALANVVTLDSTDPDQDATTYSVYTTLNDVVSVNTANDMVVASGPNSGLSLGFGSESGSQIPSAIGFDNQDAYGFLTVVDPGGVSGDIAINLAQNYGTLSSGQSKSVTWYMVFGTSKAEVTNTFAALTVIPPAITLQPVSQRVSPGCSAAFLANASGTPPLHFQWWKDGSPLGGQTNSSLVFSNVQVSDYATYYLAVTNAVGSTNSSSATLFQNHLVEAGQDVIQRLQTGDVKVQVFTLLANDIDLDGDTPVFVGVSSNSVAGGTVYRSGNWIYYVPPAGYTNSDVFTYTVTDGFCNGIVTGNVLVQIMTPIGPSHNFTIYSQPDGSVRLVFAGIPGWTYRIQYSETLPGTNWIDLGARTADTLGIYEFIDTPPSNAPMRFYRSVYP